MKKETAILSIVIAFLVRFISGATVAILKTKKSSEKVAQVQKPQMVPQGEQPPPLQVSIHWKWPPRSKR